MELENIVNIVVSELTRGVTQRGFGTPLILGVHTNTQEAVKLYSASTVLSDLVTDGFSQYDPIYRTAQSIASQSPKPTSIKVGKLTTAYTKIFTLTIADNVVEDKVYSFTLIGPDGTETSISYTALVTDDHDDVATAIAALIDAVSDIGAAAVAEVITCTATNTNESWYCKDINPSDIYYLDTTANTNLATELAVLDTIDNDYYAAVLADCQSKARCTDLAAYLQTKEKMFFLTSHDRDCIDSTSTDDTFYNLKAASYTRSVGIFSSHQEKHACAAWAGAVLPFTPGSQTWAYKSLAGIEVEDNLTTAEFAAILAKNGNYYKSVQGLSNTFVGKTLGGNWIDEIRGRDHFVQRIRERIYTIFSNNPKVPYTDAGIAQIVGALRAQVKESGANGWIDLSRDAVYNFPLASEVSAANKAARVLPGVSVSVYLAGAIHSVDPLTVIIQL